MFHIKAELREGLAIEVYDNEKKKFADFSLVSYMCFTSSNEEVCELNLELSV